jgi:hypothetical protein
VYGLDLGDSGQKALHHCDNPPCFNPEHIYVGSQSANVADMMNRGRGAGGDKPHEACAQGHPLAGPNVKPSRDGKRRCRTCARDAQRAYYRKRKARDGEFWKSHSSRALDGEEQ